METKQEQHLLVDVNNGIMNIKLNRPESLNAFSLEMISALIEAIAQGENG